jgi:hypothetical protein
LAGVQDVVTAPTLDELRTKVDEWYAGAADRGLEDARLPWDPESAQETAVGYAFNVWAHS